MIIVSSEMFDEICTRARAIGEEQFRRLVFDTNMRPEAAELIREQVVEAVAERIVDRWADWAASATTETEKEKP